MVRRVIDIGPPRLLRCTVRCAVRSRWKFSMQSCHDLSSFDITGYREGGQKCKCVERKDLELADGHPFHTSDAPRSPNGRSRFNIAGRSTLVASL